MIFKEITLATRRCYMCGHPSAHQLPVCKHTLCRLCEGGRREVEPEVCPCGAPAKEQK